MSNMFSVERHNTPVNDYIRDSVLNLVTVNITALALTHPPLSHPKFPMFRMALLVEVLAYLGAEPPHSFEIVTVSTQGRVVGFSLCGLPISGSTSEVSIYYIATDKSFRRQGVMRMMMLDIIQRYPIVSLSCDIALVPIYEKYGFRCDGLQRSQIIMVIGNPVEETPLLSIDEIMNSPDVLEESLKGNRAFPKRDIARADQAMKNALKNGEEKAKRFLKEKKRIAEKIRYESH